MSSRWTEEDLARHVNVHPRALRRNPITQALIDHGVKRGFISRELKHDYKAEFEQQLALVGIRVEREFVFAPPRKWRADWRIKDTKILIEYEGGLFMETGGAHKAVGNILRDIQKYNAAAIAGWTVIRVTPKFIPSGDALKWVEDALKTIGATSRE